MSTNYPINPRVRAFGKARIDIAEHAKDPADWARLWKPPSNSFPFAWGESWKQCVEYRVDDFAAEVGFFIDILGLPVNAFDPGYAMFTSPQGDFFFAVVPTPHGEQSTPPDAIRLQFMVRDIMNTTSELEQRGIFFEQPPQPLHPGSSLSIGYFRSPHGICVELWGMVEASTSSAVKLALVKNQKNGDENDEDDDELEEELFGDNGDKDESNKGEGLGKDQGDTEGKDDLEEDDEDDELVENDDDEDDELSEDEDEDELEEDDDDDEDESDQDDYSSTIKSNPQKADSSYRPELSRDAKSKLQGQADGEQKALPLEYIDLDAT